MRKILLIVLSIMIYTSTQAQVNDLALGDTRAMTTHRHLEMKEMMGQMFSDLNMTVKKDSRSTRDREAYTFYGNGERVGGMTTYFENDL